MTTEIRYELPMFSSSIENEPEIEFKNMDIRIKIRGYDEKDFECGIEIKFLTVIGFKQTSARFTPLLYGSYDKIVELIDSDWLREMNSINPDDFSFWKPRHFAFYLDGFGMYQFIAQAFEVSEND